MAHTEWLPGVQLRHSVPPVQFIHAFVRCLFIHAMYVVCLSMPCTLPVYPCHAWWLFIHTMHLSCLSMLRCCLFTHLMCNGYLSIPYASFLFIHAKDNGCLPIPCIFPASYPCHVLWLFIQAILLFMLYIYHVSCLSTMQHTKKSFRHSWLFLFL